MLARRSTAAALRGLSAWGSSLKPLRCLSTGPAATPSPGASGASGPSGASGLVALGILGILGGTGLYWSLAPPATAPPEVDYQLVYNDIAAILDNVDHDDGSLGPLLLRLAWHAAGTYDAATGTGGSNGATMRFPPESAHGANAGLSLARDVLKGIKRKHPNISYADLWSLSGVVAVQEMVRFV